MKCPHCNYQESGEQFHGLHDGTSCTSGDEGDFFHLSIAMIRTGALFETREVWACPFCRKLFIGEP